ncbi:MAG: L,D-transpeptidase [Campylobacterota bacterium]|nr:L,D-transpeptidase [Campylobacterota bacterium]
MKKIIILLLLLSISLSGKDRELTPISKTEFLYVNKQGREKNIDMTGKDFILISVREEESDGRFYAVDRDGTVWLSGGISSGEEVGFTPTGVWKVLWKKRFYTSRKYPEPDGTNNMNYSLFFTRWGHAIHKGSIDHTSHGCIHVHELDIPSLFHWAWNGMQVLVTRDRYMHYARPDLKRIYKTERKYRRKKKK